MLQTQCFLDTFENNKPDGKQDMFAAGDGDFLINHYNSIRPFSSFFPGIAGPFGKPLWAFYVNRGQCLCSMGIENKDHSIMEFLPANRAYQLTASQGFRTFIKITGETESIYEPFQSPSRRHKDEISQRMIIRPETLRIEDDNRTMKLLTTVRYYPVVQDDFSAMIREVLITNNSSTAREIELLDGLPFIVPYGVDNSNLKLMRRLVEAFVGSVAIDPGTVYYRMKVKQQDSPEVSRVEEGNFYASFLADMSLPDKNKLIQLPLIYEPEKVFGCHTDYSEPLAFKDSTPFIFPESQLKENQLPSAITFLNKKIEPGASIRILSIIGKADSVEHVKNITVRASSLEWFEQKCKVNRLLISEIACNNFVNSSSNAFNHYCGQNFIDNVMRGGMPVQLAQTSGSPAYYLYSRKHGDLERDYNDFHVQALPFSQGNGNFRDVNQNRRSDVSIFPFVGDHNIHHFTDLIQADGCNPLNTKPELFSINNKEKLTKLAGKETADKLSQVLKGFFTLGEAVTVCHKIFQSSGDADYGRSMKHAAFVAGQLLTCSRCVFDTDHGHGYWTDHWFYNLDLIENYLSVFPENMQRLLFEEKKYSYHDSSWAVLPREDRYVLWEGKPMQLGSVGFNKIKAEEIAARGTGGKKVITRNGEVYLSTLAAKLTVLVTVKIACLDAAGTGIEMESDKPDWYDALNGLPGIHGSSLNETLELKRHFLFLRDALAGRKNEATALPEEAASLLNSLHTLFEKQYAAPAADLFAVWDQASSLKEKYRAEILHGFSGKEVSLENEKLTAFFKCCLKRLDDGISKATDPLTGIPYSYFINEVAEYELIKGKQDSHGRACYRVLSFKQVPLPYFLEAPMHLLKVGMPVNAARSLYQAIKQSGLYDKKLQMYKVNAPLENQPMEIGRTRVFSPGWFENESIWLHMEYKYMLELLRSGLHDEFYQEVPNILIPFLNPSSYGRSTLENSSFIVSSANPNENIHGAGYVARLSGATAEFIQILRIICCGLNPYRINDKQQLELCFEPVLPASLFTSKEHKRSMPSGGRMQEITFPAGTFSFMFSGKTMVTYYNAAGKNTYGVNCVKPFEIMITDENGKQHTIAGAVISRDWAEKIREGLIEHIDIKLV